MTPVKNENYGSCAFLEGGTDWKGIATVPLSHTKYCIMDTSVHQIYRVSLNLSQLLQLAMGWTTEGSEFESR
jgi:hypothetical protein